MLFSALINSHASWVTGKAALQQGLRNQAVSTQALGCFGPEVICIIYTYSPSPRPLFIAKVKGGG